MTDLKIVRINDENKKIAYEFLMKRVVVYFGKSKLAIHTLSNTIFIVDKSSDMISKLMNDEDICKYIVPPLSSLVTHDINEFKNVKIAGSIVKENIPEYLEEYRAELISTGKNSVSDEEKIINGAQLVHHFIAKYI